jgi:NADH pyrophosphatase NudC (nudix superfamily)
MIIMLDHCPGAASLRTPTLTINKCPQCGEEVELFSNDMSVKCSGCGFVVYNDIESCIQWCRHAKECVGEEMYRILMERKSAPAQKAGEIMALSKHYCVMDSGKHEE